MTRVFNQLRSAPLLRLSAPPIRRGYHSSFSVHYNDNAQKNASKDTRLAGRVRFYKQVGVTEVPPPWELSSPAATETPAVESPISAGVDGTQSASGVTNTAASPESALRRLRPKRPGTNKHSADDKDATTNWFGITLDGKVIKTPLGQTLALPSEMLAWAVAAEWDSQEEHLLPAQMPLMTLACTALDQTSASTKPHQDTILGYLPTDTICYYADPTEDRSLYRRQEQAWTSIHDTLCQEAFGGATPAKALGASEGLTMSRVRSPQKQSIGLPHPPSVIQSAKEFVESLDAWHLTAMSSVVSESKSFLVGMALLKQLATPKQAIEAARVEEEFQIANWGLVEGGHDYDRLNCSIQIHSAQVLVSLIAHDNSFEE